MSRPPATYRAGVHRLACVTVATTVLLIFVGGVVTNTGSALAVPDWPTSFGYNMFLYPWSKMVGGIFYEHSHRLLGSGVGLLTVSLALWIYFVDPRRAVRRLMAAAVVAVIVQGVLGGMRVVLLADQIAIVHGCLAQAFLSLMVGIAVFTSRDWFVAPTAESSAAAESLRSRALIAAGAFYVQIVFGSFLSHAGSRLDFHLLFAAVATMASMVLAAAILSGDESLRRLRSSAIAILVLLGFQLVLGVGAMIVRFSAPGQDFPAWAALGFPTLHRLVGTLLIATSMALAWRVSSMADRQKAKEMVPHSDPLPLVLRDRGMPQRVAS